MTTALMRDTEEASAMQATAEQTGRLLMEAFHYRYHALAARMKEIVSGGTLGTVRRVEAQFCIYLPGRKDIRFWYETAGGALMDTGCYAVNVCRFLIGTEPTVKTATACLLKPDVDSGISAELEFANGITASVATSLRTPVWKWRAFVRVTGDDGTMTVLNPFLPQFFNCLTVQTRAGKSREFLPRHPSTYACQLEALVAAVRGGPMMPTDGLDGIQNMRVIDAIYAASGLRRRGEGA